MMFSILALEWLIKNILIFWQDFRRGLNVKWCVYVIALSHILICIFFPILTFLLQKSSTMTICGIFLSKGKNDDFCCWLELEHNKAACWNEQSLISESITFPVCELKSFHDGGQVRKKKLYDLKWDKIWNALRLNLE